jgi:hypothetical protein
MDRERRDPAVGERELVDQIDMAAGEVAGQRGGEDRLSVALGEVDRLDRVRVTLLGLALPRTDLADAK